MKCFYNFKDRGRIRAQKSPPPPNSKNQCNSDVPKVESIVKCSNSATLSQSIPKIYGERTQNLRVFTFPELRQATSNFCKLLKIGEGGFGCVYKGIIKPVDGKGESLVVAIKKLNRDGHQGHKQWLAEVQVLSVVDNPYLVKLIGYCAVDGEKGMQRLLVYEYMPNKSLEHHLFNKANPVLSWEQRLQIILGAAQGLAYLHEGLENQVIYRDFKSSNVLLDADFQPKLSDFGLAREGPTNGHTHVSTVVVGTYGYTAPDYIETGHLTSKSDVWSFGIVLYEILTGRRPLERDRPGLEQKLLDWVRQHPADSRKFHKIIDPRLRNHFPTNTARRIAKLADSCLVKNPNDRPKMGDVVETLKQIVQILGTESSSEGSEYDGDDVEDECEEEKELSESAMRRIAHLSKISENLEDGIRRKRFVMKQMAHME